MKSFTVTGMSCAACGSRVEKAVLALEGVKSCAVNVLSGSMTVDGEASAPDVIRAVENAGYAAAEAKDGSRLRDEDLYRNFRALKRRFVSSLLLLLPLLYLSMGHDMFSLPAPDFLVESHAGHALEMVLALLVMIVNTQVFVRGFGSLLRFAPNMDSLVALGSAVSFLWSCREFFADPSLHEAADGQCLYFESAAMILTFVALGKMLEERAKATTVSAVTRLAEMMPEIATAVRDGKEARIPAEELKRGEIFLVRPGETVPADGVIVSGQTSVNEAALTGESMPSDRGPGDEICAATVNLTGLIRCQAVGTGADTVFSRLVRMVKEASESKAPVARIADRVAGIFVPAVMLISFVTFCAWSYLGAEPGVALSFAVAVLVISCPCALGLATPAAIMAGCGISAKHGILFKNAQALEQAGKIRVAAFDKTGTLTRGLAEVARIVPAEGISRKELVAVACGLEHYSNHPAAAAVRRLEAEGGYEILAPESLEELPGRGVCATLEDQTLRGGSLRFIRDHVRISDTETEKIRHQASLGRSLILFARNDSYLGMIALTDQIREDASFGIQMLKKNGIRTVMISGDLQASAQAVAQSVGIDETVAGVKPDGKAEILLELKKNGPVAMIGDGVNDAPALAASDVSFAMRSGTDIASDAADVVLMNSRISDVFAAVRISRATLRVIYQNLFWAFAYNVACIPLAAGVFSQTLGWHPDPAIAAAAMSLSSICVVTNALRLNFMRFADWNNSKTLNKEDKKMNETEKKIQKTIAIEGMMCAHCEAHVRKALEALDGVESAQASHDSGSAVATLSHEVDDSALKQAVEQAGYTVTAIR
ncbi:MAG: heavy metal translocating P-type ATPase [Succinivibrionaceae bacterium]|nr:heavy metal translocating P-type ATPase [Succinivibrionaceae bacterium]